MSSAWSRLRAAVSFAFSAFAFAAVSRTRFIFSWNVSASARVGTTGAPPASPPAAFSSPGAAIFLVLAPPKPLSSATPTCACLSAPTSLAPSPHMNVCRPCCFSRFSTRSLSSGLMRAKITTESRKSHRPPAAPLFVAKLSVSPVTHSEYVLASVGIETPSATYGTTRVGFSVAGSVLAETQASFGSELSFAAPSSSSSARTMASMSPFSSPPRAMPTSFATCSAVSAESPVAIITECALALSACTTSAVSTRVAHANARNPSKIKSRSISARVNGFLASRTRADSPSPSGLCASAITRMPSSASARYAAS